MEVRDGLQSAVEQKALEKENPHGCEAVHVRGLQLNPEERADRLDVDQVIDGDGKHVAAHGVSLQLSICFKYATDPLEREIVVSQ